MADILPPAVPMGSGDDLDVAAGRCCPTCRHDLTPHNVGVWNAGYSVATRHAKDDIREAWDAGFSEACNQHTIQRRDPNHPITRENPHREVGR